MSKMFSTIREAIFLVSHPWLWFRSGLRIEDFAPHPMDQFALWYRRAKKGFLLEFPNATCLSTLNADGYPEGRMVLIKSFDRSGFIFYTNTKSQKGRSLAQTPRAGLTCYWSSLQWQVRVIGDVTQVSDDEADAYFSSRPRESQLGAWASLQSEEMVSRRVLEDRMGDFRRQFADKPVPRPPHWHGYLLAPQRVEFWELRLSRLHDRIVYERTPTAGWRMVRLYP